MLENIICFHEEVKRADVVIVVPFIFWLSLRGKFAMIVIRHGSSTHLERAG
jgi:hypothetical protein